MTANGITLTLAYPETIVMVADEWYSPYLRFLGVGKKNYIRAGHVALVLIHKETGVLEYHDFGRYITPESSGRVRGKETDHELEIPITAIIENEVITNLEDILKFFATHPKLTHGEGTMYASICNAINYESTKSYINTMQQRDFIRYGAFIKDASNCARFVTDSLIAGVTDNSIKKKLIKSKQFTPSTIGNVVISNTQKKVFKVSEEGEVTHFKSSVSKENRRLFLDRLKHYQPNCVGTIEPKHNTIKHDNAQWLSGIGTGAWFELHDLNHDLEFRFRRVSPHGNIDVDGVYKISNSGFDMTMPHEFVQYSNCKFFHVKQQEIVYRFDFLRKNQ
jgi:hypothetical protein